MVYFNFLKSCQDTILSIIEDKPRFEIPKIVFKFIILISYLQILIYLFSDFQMVTIDESKLKSFFYICEMVSIVNILNLKRNDNLSITVYIIAHIILFLYFAYVAILTLCIEYLKDFYNNHYQTFLKINELLNLYFTFYLNVFLSQYIELNCSLLFCSQKSIFSSQYTHFTSRSQCEVPTWQTILSIIGISLAIATAFITSYYFRNYEFLEKNVLKRKSTFLFQFLITIRIIIPFIDFNGSIQGAKQAKHVLSQIYGCVSIIDYFLSIPFTDQDISKFYLVIIAYFEGIVTCSNFYLLGRNINGQEMFYMSILSTLVLSVTLQQALNFQYESMLKRNWVLEKIIPNLDYYLEQMVVLGEKSIYNEEAKVKIQKAYKLHRSNCKIVNCICLKYPCLNMKIINDSSINQKQEIFREATDQEIGHLIQSEINIKLIYKFVDGIFQWMFSQKCLSQNTQEFEKLSLKYISFMMKYQNNQVRAYYELKVLQLRKTSFSIYFNTIANIISQKIQDNIESQIDQVGSQNLKMFGDQIKNSRNSKLSRTVKNELTVQSIIDVEQICAKYMPQFLQLIDHKHELWVKLQDGYKSMNDLQIDAIKLMKELNQVKSTYLRAIKKAIQINPDIENSLQFQKLTQIFYLFVVNDTIKSIQIETQILELKKRDTLAELDQLKNVSMIKGDICVIEISLSENLGKIVSKKDEKTASFFGFSQKQDFMKINHINDLMPNFIGRVHNDLLKNFIQGQSIRSKMQDKTILSHIKQNDGYIFPVKIHFDFSFNTSSQDFRMNGIILKNRAEQDYIIFHRSGQIVAMTRHIAKILFQEFNRLPNGDAAIQKLNALLMFPKIVKKIIKNRDLIYQDLTEKSISDQQFLGDSKASVNTKSKSLSTMTTMIEDSFGSMRFSSNPFNAQKKFMRFLNQKVQYSQGSLKNNYRYEDIDLLDKSSLKLLKQYEDQNIGQSTNRSHHDSTDRLLSGKAAQARDLQDTDLFNKARMIQTTNSQVSKQQMEYKMMFEYQLQYCLLNQKTQQTQTKYNNKSISSQFTMNTKQKEYKDEFQDIYFQVKIENITVKQCEKKIKYKPKETFIRNLVKYLRSTTSIFQLIDQLQGVIFLKNVSNSAAIDTTDEIKLSSQENNKLSNDSTLIVEQLAPQKSRSAREDFKDIPKNMLQLLQSQQQVTAFEEECEDWGKVQKKEQKRENKNNSSFKSSDTSQFDESDAQSEDIDFDKIYNQAITQISNNKSSKEFQDQHNSQLENLVQNFCSQKNQLIQLDPNYQIKKILQKRSLCYTFSKAFEIAFTESAFILEQERRDLKTKFQVKNLNYEQIYKEDIYLPMTFRQQTDNSMIELSMDKIPIRNLAILDSNTQRDGQKKVFLQELKSQNFLSYQISDNNLDQSFVSELKNVQENQDQIFQNALEQSKLHAFNTSIDIYQKNVDQKEKDQSYLDISARPILDKSNSQFQDQNQKQTQSIINQSQLNHQKKISFYSTEQILETQQNAKEQTKRYQIKINEQTEKTIFKSNQQIDQIKIVSSNSSQKEQNEDAEDSNNVAQEQAVAKILNQKGMITGKNSLQRASVNSSSRTSSSYAGIFLKEILIKQKIPKSAQQYKFLLLIFLVTFLCLDITNLITIQNDMQRFASNVIVLRQPRRLLRAYGKVLFGYYLSLEVQLGYLIDTDNSIKTTYNLYMNSAINEYKNVSETYNTQLMQLQLQQLQDQQDSQELTYTVYVKRKQQLQNVSKALQFSFQEQFIYQMNQTFKDYVRVDSFLYLRTNYFNFSNQILQSINYLVDDTINSVNSLINKFYIVIICAIFSIILVAIISIPVLKSINFYEEKIMMIVTRINYDQSEMEKAKIQVCKQLVNVDYIDWLNYNYFDIFNMQAKENRDLNQSQSSKHYSQQNQLSLLNSKNKMRSTANVKQAKKQLQVSGGQLIETSNFQMSSTLQMGKSFFSSQPKIKNQLHLTHFNKQKQALQQQNVSRSVKSKQYGSSNKFGSSGGNNYTLQSRIGVQNLRIFDRFLTLFILTILNTIFFLILIIYLSQSVDSLKVPVQMNQRSINLHVIMVNLKIATELLSFDFYVRDNLWSDYQVTNLEEFYNQIDQSLKTLYDIQQQNTDIIYGKNPFPSYIVSQLKDMQEGRGCQYLSTYPCKDKQQVLGIINAISQKDKFVREYPEVLNPTKTPEDQLKVFLNSQPHLEGFVFSFLSEDELFDAYSAAINSSISIYVQKSQKSANLKKVEIANLKSQNISKQYFFIINEQKCQKIRKNCINKYLKYMKQIKILSIFNKLIHLFLFLKVLFLIPYLLYQLSSFFNFQYFFYDFSFQFQNTA
ncbi:transmembrane protein, putative (macronuclear) [Tetrahymena thermophila SB210]|uniref:Transmembrane protein, putative n=1 Tax=Tetrahymena thermophila (strain SB210) TaxID=312017 RepID=I7M449_TETTS|nr:transmembrane protein, putative [Tetrahymena thermophila SB210]EAS04906.3 transmembrane protein, putative [Tetrahymena thermophila SB210]|eukprot:XP_001025151.3 transmembrane protein, putative [Tetrahymena thermophila SB210]